LIFHNAPNSPCYFSGWAIRNPAIVRERLGGDMKLVEAGCPKPEYFVFAFTGRMNCPNQIMAQGVGIILIRNEICKSLCSTVKPAETAGCRYPEYIVFVFVNRPNRVIDDAVWIVTVMDVMNKGVGFFVISLFLVCASMSDPGESKSSIKNTMGTLLTGLGKFIFPHA
jgi:hypothetical protein